MRKRTFGFLTICCAVMVLAALSLFKLPAPLTDDEATNRPVYPIMRMVRYSFLVTNTTDETLHNAKFMTFAPVPQTAIQKVVSLTANQSYKTIEDEVGNRQLEFTLAVLPPYSSKNVVITAEIALAGKPNHEILESKEANRYVSDERYLDLSSPYIESISHIFDEAPDKAKSIYNWLIHNIEDVGYIAEDRGAEYALKYLKGDCTEYMYSFVALARYQGIPSRSMAGFWLDKSGSILKAGNYHNWAEYYDGKRWVLADPQRQNFDDEYSNYIAFRQISDKEVSPLVNAERFLSFDSRLRISMN